MPLVQPDVPFLHGKQLVSCKKQQIMFELASLVRETWIT
jgi:hypothetical protein